MDVGCLTVQQKSRSKCYKRLKGILKHKMGTQ